MIQELDLIALIDEIPKYGLKPGDIGAVVLVHDSGEGFEVEFATLDNQPLTVVSLRKDQIRTFHEGEIAHTRMI